MDSWSPRGPCGPGTVGTMPSCGLIKNFFSCASLSACSICRGTIGASPGPNLSAQSAAAPCNIYIGWLHNIATIQPTIVWSDVSIKEQQAPVPSASAHSLCNSSGEKFFPHDPQLLAFKRKCLTLFHCSAHLHK